MHRFLNFKSLAWFFGMLSIYCIGVGFAYGQAISGNLTGTVSDPAGAAVNGAQVQATNVDTGQQITTTTKGSGDYLFSNLPVGTYTVSATAPTFQTTTVSNVPVVLNKTGTANVQLQIGKSSTTVEVSGAAPPVDTTTAQLESSYNDRFSQDLGLTSAGWRRCWCAESLIA
jgi:Carboxypeptidase regulatory-like domain